MDIFLNWENRHVLAVTRHDDRNLKVEVDELFQDTLGWVSKCICLFQIVGWRDDFLTVAIVTTCRCLEDVFFRKVNIFQIKARCHNLVRSNCHFSLVWEEVLLKDTVLRNAKQVCSLWELTVFDNSVKAVSVDIFKLISENITAVCQLAKGIYVIVGCHDNLRHTRRWTICCRIKGDNLVAHVDSWNSHHLTELATTDDPNGFSWAHL